MRQRAQQRVAGLRRSRGCREIELVDPQRNVGGPCAVVLDGPVHRDGPAGRDRSGSGSGRHLELRRRRGDRNQPVRSCIRAPGRFGHGLRRIGDDEEIEVALEVVRQRHALRLRIGRVGREIAQMAERAQQLVAGGAEHGSAAEIDRIDPVARRRGARPVIGDSPTDVDGVAADPGRGRGSDGGGEIGIELQRRGGADRRRVVGVRVGVTAHRLDDCARLVEIDGDLQSADAGRPVRQLE